jgi:TRAP-type C4-dicarboxylate transport system permease small subunit
LDVNDKVRSEKMIPFLILAEPQEMFTTIKSRAPWIFSLACCATCFFVVVWLGGCWTNIREGLRWWSLLGPAIVSILFVGVASCGSTMVLYAAQRVVVRQRSNRSTYRTLFSLNTHCLLIVILGEAINFLLMHTEIIQDYDLPLPKRFPLGLDLLLLVAKDPNIYLAILLHGASIFILWYLVVLAKGLKYVSGSNMSRSVATVAALWLVAMALIIGMVHGAGGGTVFHISL